MGRKHQKGYQKPIPQTKPQKTGDPLAMAKAGRISPIHRLNGKRIFICYLDGLIKELTNVNTEFEKRPYAGVVIEAQTLKEAKTLFAEYQHKSRTQADLEKVEAIFAKAGEKLGEDVESFLSK